MTAGFDKNGDLWIPVAPENTPTFPSVLYSGTTGESFQRINLTQYIDHLIASAHHRAWLATIPHPIEPADGI